MGKRFCGDNGSTLYISDGKITKIGHPKGFPDISSKKYKILMEQDLKQYTLSKDSLKLSENKIEELLSPEIEK